MTATVHERGQMVIPAKVRKALGIDVGDVFAIRTEGDNTIVLHKLQRPKAITPSKVKITYRRGSHAVATCGRPITTEQVKALLADFP